MLRKSDSLILLVFLLGMGLSTCMPDAPPSPFSVMRTPLLASGLPPQKTARLTPSSSPTRRQTQPLPATLAPSATVLPVHTTTPTALACMQTGGRIETASLHTKLLPLPLDYRVYLPPCYSQQPERRYPVLYLFHGQGFTDDQWDRLGAGETADRLIAADKIPPFLIVMPRDRYGGQPSEDNFGQVVAGELIPYVDNHYRTLTERNFRAVGGLSRGAGWSVHMALTYWKLFGALGAHSPAIFYEDAQHMRPLLDSIPMELMPRIYLDAGDKDRVEILDAAHWFEDLLNARGIPHEWHLFSGYHEEAYWKAHLEQYLLWYAEGW